MTCELCTLEEQKKNGSLTTSEYLNKRNVAVGSASRDDLMSHGWLY